MKTKKQTRQTLLNAALLSTGFILSPLSWWNDMLVNVPLAYVFSWPFTVIDEHWFLPAFILGYWLSNVLGLLMLHWGGRRMIHRQQPAFSLKKSFMIAFVYSALVIVLVLANWLPAPTELITGVK